MTQYNIRTLEEIKAGLDEARAILIKGHEAVAEYLMYVSIERASRRAQAVKAMRIQIEPEKIDDSGDTELE